jgi:hypothetical protein
MGSEKSGIVVVGSILIVWDELRKIEKNLLFIPCLPRMISLPISIR